MFLKQETKIVYNQRQELLINLSMRQAFHVMQLPIMELAEWLQQEIENNPVLELDLTKETLKEPLEAVRKVRDRAQEQLENRRKTQQENRLCATPSLYEHLIGQVSLHFEKGKERSIAELIVGHLNEKGFLDMALQEVAPSIPLAELQQTLKRLQALDPPGMGARDVRESLLFQLEAQGKLSSLAYQIIENHFEALLHNRLPLIARSCGISLNVLTTLVHQEIRPLDPYPGYRFRSPSMTAIIPDVSLYEIEGKWRIEINTTLIPQFHLSPLYERTTFESGSEECSYIKQKITSGKWLQSAVQKRNHTLQRIVELLLKKQSAFFAAEGKGTLVALTTKLAADELGLHESTVARAVAHKFLACPQGLFALRHFFKQGIECASGDRVSNQTLKELLLRAVELEDKQRPLSDDQLSHQFRKKGLSCARRTISKYRAALNIAPASQRRQWKSKARLCTFLGPKDSRDLFSEELI